jgi:hypothetical protein
VFYSRGWEYVDGGGTAWPMMDMRSEVSPLGMHWRDDAAVEFQRL